MRALAGAHLPRLDDADVHRRMPARGHRVGHAHRSRLGADDALVADLAAAFRVEGRAVEHDLACVAGLERRNRGAAFQECDDSANVR